MPRDDAIEKLMETKSRTISAPEEVDPQPGSQIARQIQMCRQLIAESQDSLAITHELRRRSIGLLWPEGMVYRCMTSIPPGRPARRIGQEPDIETCLAEGRTRLAEARARIAGSHALIVTAKIRVERSRRAIERQPSRQQLPDGAKQPALRPANPPQCFTKLHLTRLSRSSS